MADRTWILVYVNTEPLHSNLTILELYRLSFTTARRVLDCPVYVYDTCYELNNCLWNDISHEFQIQIVNASMLDSNVVMHTLDILLSQNCNIIYLTYNVSLLTRYSKCVSETGLVNCLNELFDKPVIYALLSDESHDIGNLSQASLAIIPNTTRHTVHSYLQQNRTCSLFDMNLSPIRNWFVVYSLQCVETECRISSLIQELRALSCTRPKINWIDYLERHTHSTRGLAPSTSIYAVVSYESTDYQKLFLDDAFFYYPVLDVCSELLSVCDKSDAPSDPLLWTAGNEHPNIFNTNGFYPKHVDSSKSRTLWFRRFSYPTSGLFVRKPLSKKQSIPRVVHHLQLETFDNECIRNCSINSWKTLIRSPWIYKIWTVQDILDRLFLASTEATVWFRLYHMYKTDTCVQSLILMLGLLDQLGGIAMIGEYIPRKIFDDEMLTHEFWTSFRSEERTGTNIDFGIVASVPHTSTIKSIRTCLETSHATLEDINCLVLSDPNVVIYPSYYTHITSDTLSIFSSKTVCANISW